MRRRQHPRVTVPQAMAAAVTEPRIPQPTAAPPEAPEALTPALRDPADLEREAALARLFELHYASMLRLAVLLGADDPENVVAEAYYQIYRKWRRLREPGAAEAYLRSTVCNLTRMRIRHLQVARKHVENPTEEIVVSAESAALLRDDQCVLIDALQQLPTRQREAPEGPRAGFRGGEGRRPARHGPCH